MAYLFSLPRWIYFDGRTVTIRGYAILSGPWKPRRSKQDQRRLPDIRKPGREARRPGDSPEKNAALIALRSSGGQHDLALRNAVRLWAESNTDATSDHQADLI